MSSNLDTAKRQTLRKLRGMDVGDITPQIDASYLVKGIFPSSCLAAVVGSPSAGKTFLLTDVLCHIAAGMPWHSHRVTQGLVVACALEGGAGIQNRYATWQLAHPNVPKGIPLRLMADTLNFRSPADVDALIAFVKEAEQAHGEACACISVDTLSRAMAGGNENSPDDMGALIAGADRLRTEIGAAVIFSHHLGKDVDRGARGHSSLFAALDCELTITENSGRRVVKMTKQRDGKTLEMLSFTLQQVELGVDADGEPVTSCVVVDVSTDAVMPDKRRVLSDTAQIVMKALAEEIEKNGVAAPASLQVARSVKVSTLEQWYARFEQRYGNDSEGNAKKVDTVSKAFRRGKENLVAKGIVMIYDPYAWIP